MHKAGVSSPISSKALVSIVALALLAALGFVSVVFLHRQRAFLFDRDDPLGYYVYLRSLLHDRDLSLACFFRIPYNHRLLVELVAGLFFWRPQVFGTHTDSRCRTCVLSRQDRASSHPPGLSIYFHCSSPLECRLDTGVLIRVDST